MNKPQPDPDAPPRLVDGLIGKIFDIEPEKTLLERLREALANKADPVTLTLHASEARQLEAVLGAKAGAGNVEKKAWRPTAKKRKRTKQKIRRQNRK